MARWQKHARLGVGLLGIAFAIVVYAAIGDRQTTLPVLRPERLDPRAVLESAGAAFQQFRETKREFVIEAERQLTYEDDTTKFVGITIRVHNRGGRDFTVSGREGQAGKNEEDLEIIGSVKLTASDGFTVTADRATFTKSDSTVRVPGAVSFYKGGMSGTGTGMTYNQASDVLTLEQDARVSVADEAGKIQTQFTSGSATLARRDKYLALEGRVHTIRNDQVLDADRGVARLSEDEERITFIELRGNARVAGGGAFDTMSAQDIDLDYTEDGETLERVALRGSGTIAMKAEQEGTASRQFVGDTLDLAFAADSSLIGAVGRGNVRVDLPEAGGASDRNIRARAFDASGEPGKGLTSAQFAEDVEYREGGKPPRTARSAGLRLSLAGDAVTNAVFTGGVNFQEEGLQATAMQGDYEPTGGTLRLSGGSGVTPRVTNPDIDIDATSIAVTLEGVRIVANGNVKTVLRQQDRASSKAPSTGDGAAAADGRLPSLLKPSEPVNVNANALDYHDAAGKAVYTGAAALWQGETAIRGDVLTLDRTKGDFIASGAARSTIVLDTGPSVGRAEEIRYDDAGRRITYSTPNAPPQVPAIKTVTVTPAQVSGPQGDLRARRVDLVLAGTTSRMERLEAYTEVNVRIDKRVATGDRLTYEADAERYVMTGIATVPVKITEECRETTGRTVTFFKSGDRIIVDGNEEVRTQSSRSGPCPQPTSR